MLGVAPIRGRQFTREDTLPGAEDVAVLSSELWRSAFGGDEAVVGRAVPIDGAPTRIVGIMPPGYDVHDRARAGLAAVDDRSGESWRPGRPFPLSRRPPEGRRHLAQARVELESLLVKWPQRSAGHAPNTKTHRLRFDGLQDDLVGGLRTALWVLQGAVAFVLLIACANLANLMLARAESRQREFAIRSALGAGRWRLLRQFLTEGIVLALAGGALGAVLGFGGLRALLAANPESLPRSGEIALDPDRALVHDCHFAGDGRALRPVAAPAPARARRQQLAEGSRAAIDGVGRAHLGTSRTGDVGSGARGRARDRRRPAAAELLEPDERRCRIQSQPAHDVRSRAAERDVSDVRSRSWISSRASSRSCQQLPGVQGAAAMQGLPPQRQVNANDTDFENYMPPPDGPFENIDYYQNVTPTYLTTLGIPLIDGRDFAPSDIGGTPVALVNETLAKTFFRDQTPLGRRLKPGFGAQLPVVHDRRRRPRRQARRRRAEDGDRDLLPRRPGTARPSISRRAT